MECNHNSQTAICSSHKIKPRIRSFHLFDIFRSRNHWLSTRRDLKRPTETFMSHSESKLGQQFMDGYKKRRASKIGLEAIKASIIYWWHWLKFSVREKHLTLDVTVVGGFRRITNSTCLLPMRFIALEVNICCRSYKYISDCTSKLLNGSLLYSITLVLTQGIFWLS